MAPTFSARFHSCACYPLVLAHWHPSASRGPHSRSPSHASAFQHVTTCRACGSGALRRPVFSTTWLFRAVLASHTPWPARTHHPPFAPVSPRLLLCGSLSYSLPPHLSCSLLLSLSPVAPLCSFPTVLCPLSLSFSLSLPLAQKKGGSGRSVHLYPPRGSNHPLRNRRGVVYPLGHDDWVSAPCATICLSCVSPPFMCIFFRMGVCSAACRGTAQRPGVPGPPA